MRYRFAILTFDRRLDGKTALALLKKVHEKGVRDHQTSCELLSDARQVEGMACVNKLTPIVLCSLLPVDGDLRRGRERRRRGSFVHVLGNAAYMNDDDAMTSGLSRDLNLERQYR